LLWFEDKAGFDRINRLGAGGKDFFFLISYDHSRIFADSLDRLPTGLLYRLDDWKNYDITLRRRNFTFKKKPLPFEKYHMAIQKAQDEIRAGNTYLLNLTFPTPVITDLDLQTIFLYAAAPYKLYVPNHFTCFSPEKFITIRNNTITTYPMKGTIDASIPQAEEKILKNPKEAAEHVMITDLMRNDLSRIADNTRVLRFRYLDRIKAGEKELLQVSSEILADLPPDWRTEIGTILREITPAGSVTGTPKRKTIEIISRIENYDRGFYTGIFGVCRGKELRAAVLIRFIEQNETGLLYKSGGGITLESDPRREYTELIDKIYLPL